MVEESDNEPVIDSAKESADREIRKEDLEFNIETYEKCLKIFDALEDYIGLKIYLHAKQETLEQGQIFLFNHFARFETVIPVYLFYQRLGAFTRTIADHNLFISNEKLGRFLLGAGAVPNDMYGLLPFLAAEILKGRKVVIFPEGRMVKSKRVMDEEGEFGIFSHSLQSFRKHHTGAAVLALTLDLFKYRIKELFRDNDLVRLDHWCEALEFQDHETLRRSVEKPTLIVPGTITFSPLRMSPNLVSKAIRMLSGELSSGALEELIIESNILFKDTDMDIRLGEAIRAHHQWSWWEDRLVRRYFLSIQSLEDFFSLKKRSGTITERLLSRIIYRETNKIRDAYIKGIYQGVTVNLAHIASVLIFIYLERGYHKIDKNEFHRALYFSIKQLQNLPDIHLHYKLGKPEKYRPLLQGKGEDLQQFLLTVKNAGLMTADESYYLLEDRLMHKHERDTIRLQNPVKVNANEVAPVPEVNAAIASALDLARSNKEIQLAYSLWDDELREYASDLEKFTRPEYDLINLRETARGSREPYLLLQKQAASGILLIHGFNASPPELWEYGEHLHQMGFNVLGLRLPGHGTSPYDLSETHWEDWLESVRRNYEILSALSEGMYLLGFSTGGTLALMLAAEQPAKLRALAVVCAAIKMQDKKLHLASFLNAANRMAKLFPKIDGIMNYKKSGTESPETNYQNMPVSALSELHSLAEGSRKKLKKVKLPLMIVQSDADPVVEPESAQIIFNSVKSREKTLHWIESTRHNILREKVAETWAVLDDFFSGHAQPGVAGSAGQAGELPWAQAYPPGLSWEFAAIDKTVHTIFEESARTYPERACLDFLGSKSTYADIQQLIDRFAAGLQRIGVKKGDRIGLCLPNCPYYIVTYFAALKVGAIVVNFNILYTAREIEQQIEDSGVGMMITLDLKYLFKKIYPCLEKGSLDVMVYCPLAELLPPAKRQLLKLFKFFQFVHPQPADNLYTYEQLTSIAEKPREVAINPREDIALYQYTGGTTGTPKAAMLTHSNIVSNTEQVSLWLQQGEKLSGQEKFLAVLPFFHVFSMTVAMNMALRAGAEIFLLPRFELKQCLDLIDAEKITIFPGVPAIFNAINHYPKLEHYSLASLRYGICGGAALPQEVKRNFELHSDCALLEGYGLSESSPVITCNPPHSGGKAGSIGLPLPGTEVEFRHIDDVGQIQQRGEIGQLVVRGPQVMKGYWRRPDENRDTLLQDGWLSTGDLGYMDEDGFIFLTDRIKDVIITNGYNVYPRVIEDAFYTHPEVEEVIAVGIPDKEKGEVPKVFVRLKTGAEATSADLQAYIKDKLNPLELPASIEIRQELPKTLIGKPSKKALLEEEARRRVNEEKA